MSNGNIQNLAHQATNFLNSQRPHKLPPTVDPSLRLLEP